MTRAPRLFPIIVLMTAVIVIPTAPAFAPCHIITFEGDPYTADEDEGSVTITVSKNGPVGAPTVDWETDDDTAKAPGDYTAASGTLTLQQSEETFEVTIKNDTSDEANERFFVRLSNPTNGGCTSNVTVQEDTAVVTIQDDDEKPVAQPTKTAAPKRPAPKPTPTRTQTPTPTPSPTSTQSATETPTPTQTASVVAQSDADGGGGVSVGALAGIAAAVVVVGGAAAYLVRRRFLS